MGTCASGAAVEGSAGGFGGSRPRPGVVEPGDEVLHRADLGDALVDSPLVVSRSSENVPVAVGAAGLSGKLASSGCMADCPDQQAGVAVVYAGDGVAEADGGLVCEAGREAEHSALPAFSELCKPSCKVGMSHQVKKTARAFTGRRS